MTNEWGGAQWLLAAYLVVMTVCPPMLRWALLEQKPEAYAALAKPKPVKDWQEFWYSWSGDVIGRVVLVMLLRWGGFW